MTINSIPIFYWKKLCNVRSFDLTKKSHRLLTVLFWIILITSITLLVFVSISYFTEKDIQEKNKAVIEEFEANFSLNRFYEKLAEDVKILNSQLTSSDGLINSNFKKEALPKGYSLVDVNNVINKISNQIILRETSLDYNDRELKLLDNLANRLGYKQYSHRPSSDLIATTEVLINFSNGFHTNDFFDSQSTDFYNQFIQLHEDIFVLNKASLSHTNAKYYNLECCYYSWLSKDSTAYYTINYWDKLSIEDALNISNALPDEYSIDSYDRKLKDSYNSNQGQVIYSPTYLVDPFAKLTFYNPNGFNPLDLKTNLYKAKKAIGSSSEIFNKFIFSLMLIIGLNTILVFSIRIIYWINNG